MRYDFHAVWLPPCLGVGSGSGSGLGLGLGLGSGSGSGSGSGFGSGSGLGLGLGLEEEVGHWEREQHGQQRLHRHEELEGRLVPVHAHEVLGEGRVEVAEGGARAHGDDQAVRGGAGSAE